MRRTGDAGLTMIEVLVSLALFALIAGAGFSMLDQVLRAQSQTETRLARLTDMQRLMHIVMRDFSEGLPGTVQGDGAAATVSREGLRGQVTVTFSLTAGAFIRSVAKGAGAPGDTTLLQDVTALRWQFLDGKGAWHDAWPDPADNDATDLRAVSLTVSMPPEQGDLHRLVALSRKATQ